jgi:hydrocephalus-inducing protein
LDPKIYDKVVLASFVLDFQNIVLGSSKKRQFKIKNTNKFTQMQFTIDPRVYKPMGLTISPDRPTKLNPQESQTITVTYQTKKSLKSGKNRLMVPIEVKNGPKYNLMVMANLTVPEIFVENKNIDFGKVIVGQRKTIFMKFENNKEVVCDWNVSTRAELVGPSEKESNRFAINHLSG